MKKNNSTSFSFLILFLLVAITAFIVFLVAREGETLDQSIEGGFEVLNQIDELQGELDETRGQ